MKLIKCSHCGADKIGPKTEKWPNGSPVAFAKWTGQAYPLILKCGRCTNAIRISAVQFNGLPSLTDHEKDALGFSA